MLLLMRGGRDLQTCRRAQDVRGDVQVNPRTLRWRQLLMPRLALRPATLRVTYHNGSTPRCSLPTLPVRPSLTRLPGASRPRCALHGSSVASTFKSWPENDFADVCKLWNNSARAILAFQERYPARVNNYLAVKYEDDVARPAEFVASVCDRYSLDPGRNPSL
jgi:hypothetical protein